ncbi:MAG: RNA pyrophosphohydrolase [bacterium]|nr:RNA pyrophosphohydrolase [bacterium]
MKKSDTSTPLYFPYFRTGVGAVIFGKGRGILSFERADKAGSWQSVQGGIDVCETPVEALFREIREETGLSKEKFELITEFPHWLAYEFPVEKREKRKGSGQVQRWFLLKLKVSESEIKLSGNGHKTEFRAWKWTTLERHAREVVGFKRGVYKAFAEYFLKYVR